MKRIVFIISLVAFLLPNLGAQSIDFDQVWGLNNNTFTEEEYRESTSVAPLCTDPLIWKESMMLRKKPRLKGRERYTPLYLLVVDLELYDYIKHSLYQYAQLVTSRTNYDVQIVQVNSLGSAVSLRNKLASLRPNLAGCLFVGDIPYAQYQIEKDSESKYNITFPCDLFFMDLDGEWIDKQTNPGKEETFIPGPDGIYDNHFGNVDPEIFIGRLPYYSFLDREKSQMLINQYLERLITHWMRYDGIKNRALSYINHSWAKSSAMAQTNASRLSPLESAGFTIDYINGLEHMSFFNVKDYVKRISSKRYSYVHLWSHSSSRHHSFDNVSNNIGGSLTYNEIYSSILYPIMYNLFCCSATRWTAEKEDLANGTKKEYVKKGFLGGAYLYGTNSNTLALIGSTKVGSMIDSKGFHEYLAQSNPIGLAHLLWWKHRPKNFMGSYTYNDKHWHYGLTILGDPLVRLVNPVDLYMQDAQDDDGSMPNNLDNIDYNFWESEDIWIRNQRDGGTEHQNPVYKEGKPVYVYARIRNQGIAPSQPGASITLRWSQAGISLDYDSFLGKNTIGDDIKTGGLIGKASIPSVAPGESVIVCFPWFLMNPDRYKDFTQDAWHYCMLAEIESVEEPISVKMNNLRDYVKTYNNVVMKNIYNIEVSDDGYGLISGLVSIHNPYKRSREYEICVSAFKKGSSHHLALTEIAEVSLIPNQELLQALKKPQVELMQLHSLQTEPRLIAQADVARINRVQLAGGEQGLLNVKFNFKEEVAQLEEEFVCRVVLKDKETGANVGGETYIIKKRPRPKFETSFDYKLDREKVHLSAKAINEPAIYRWRNTAGELLYEGHNFTASARDSVKLEVEAKSDGVKGEALFVGSPQEGTSNLLLISPNPAKDNLVVKVNMDTEVSLVITAVADGCSYIYPILKERVLDVSGLPRGNYLVSLFLQEEMYDQQTIILE